MIIESRNKREGRYFGYCFKQHRRYNKIAREAAEARRLERASVEYVATLAREERGEKQ